MTNEAERPSVEGLMEVARQYAHAYFNRYTCPTHPGYEGDEPRFKASLRAYAERLSLSAQPVASKELSDEQIGAIFAANHNTRELPWKNWRRFARAILAASRLDGANAGEKP